MYTIVDQPIGWSVFMVFYDLQRHICTQQMGQPTQYIVNILQPVEYSN